jgi:hypothetical protein
MRSASKHSYASGALRAPGASTTSRTPRPINSSTITRAHAVALPTSQLPGSHETSLPEPLHLVVGLVPLQRGLVDCQFAHLDHPVHGDQWLHGQIIGEQRDRVEPAGIGQFRQRSSQRKPGPDPDRCLKRTLDDHWQTDALGNLQAGSYAAERLHLENGDVCRFAL